MNITTSFSFSSNVESEIQKNINVESDLETAIGISSQAAILSNNVTVISKDLGIKTVFLKSMELCNG